MHVHTLSSRLADNACSLVFISDMFLSYDIKSLFCSDKQQIDEVLQETVTWIQQKSPVYNVCDSARPG